MRQRPFLGLLVSMGCVIAAFTCNDAGFAAERTDRSGHGAWPMWRCDAGRTGVSAIKLPDRLHLQWTRELPPVEPAFRNSRLQFDAGYEPIVAGGLLIVGSSADDSVTAYDVVSGAPRWRFFSGGPVRFAPAAAEDRVFVGSDDGCLYCLQLATGDLVWKRQAVPNPRKVLGNRRLISVWPVRGGPVVADDCVYFAAGVFPFEGVFVYAVNAKTGDVLWRNDRLGFLYGPQPHGTEALSGLAPQGYLVVNGDQLIVPCGSAYPATLNRDTGELISFELPNAGREPGGWFAAVDADSARDVRRGAVPLGELVLDRRINQQQHEDKVYTGQGQPGIQSTLIIGGKSFDLTQEYPGVDGTVHSILAAAGRLFVVTREATVSCFGAEPVANPPAYSIATDRRAAAPSTAAPSTATLSEEAVKAARQLIRSAGRRYGYAVVWGLRDGQLLEAIVRDSDFTVIGVDQDDELIDQLRDRFKRKGLYGSRVSLMAGDGDSVRLPRYLAELLTTEDAERLFSADGPSAVPVALECLRPYGGGFSVIANTVPQAAIERMLSDREASQFEFSNVEGVLTIRRTGALPGATDYTGGWTPSRDALVRAPVSLLWFDDTVAHFKRSPQPHFIGGTMVSYIKDWHFPRDPDAKGLDYPLEGPILSDVYTGRVLEDDEAVELRARLAAPVAGQREPNQYRPPRQKNDWSPEPPQPGRRWNPLTGLEEPRVFPKLYGCDGGFDYGDLYTMRSATAAFYDKTCESGTVHIAGPRSGCTNSVIPACGLLNVPYFYEGCTCSYPLPTGLALVSMPETFEQWSVWGPSLPTEIQRIGVNFGAPGDRITRGGTLWLDVPSVGGPSPELQTETHPADPRYAYEHSVWYSAGQGWPWVNASCVEGLDSFRLGNLKPGTYTVRLFFADGADVVVGQRIQDVAVQGNLVLEGFDIIAAAGAAQAGVVHTLHDVAIDGDFRFQLSAKRGRTRISGVELIRDGLPVEDLPGTIASQTVTPRTTKPAILSSSPSVPSVPLQAADPGSQRFEFSKRASEIDSRCREHPEIDFVFTDDQGKPADLQHAMVDLSVPSQGKLVIWLMAYNAGLAERITSYGLHTIQVSYANRWFSRLTKQPHDDSMAIGRVRLEAATGEDHSPLVSIPKPDGMMERSLQFVRWLSKEHPAGKWEQFLTADGDGLRWDKVILSGISHGSTTAARFAIHQKVDRVVMFSGPRDNTETWQGLPSATSSNRFFGFTHVLDAGWVGDHYCRSWQLLQMHDYGPIVNVDDAKPPYGATRRLVTNSDVQNNSGRAHTTVVPGGTAGKDSAGHYIHEEVWRYLFTHPVDQSGPAVPMDADCEMDQRRK